MLIIRSLAFNVAFYASLIVQMIFWSPYYFLSQRHRAWFVPKFWARTCLWLMEKIAGAAFWPSIRLLRQCTLADDPAEVSVTTVLL